MKIVSTQNFDPLCTSQLRVANGHTVPGLQRTIDGAAVSNGMDCNPCANVVKEAVRCCCNCWRIQFPGATVSGGDGSDEADANIALLNAQLVPATVYLKTTSSQVEIEGELYGATACDQFSSANTFPCLNGDRSVCLWDNGKLPNVTTGVSIGLEVYYRDESFVYLKIQWLLDNAYGVTEQSWEDGSLLIPCALDPISIGCPGGNIAIRNPEEIGLNGSIQVYGEDGLLVDAILDMSTDRMTLFPIPCASVPQSSSSGT